MTIQIQLTPKGYKSLKTDKQKLEKKREQVLVRLQTAREMGDLSENAAYHAAKFELGNIDRRLSKLNELIRFGKPTKPHDNKSIQFGHTVDLKSEGEKVNFTLVSSHESNPSENKLSIDSPLGKELLGKKPGEKATLKIENTERSRSTTYTIEKIN